MKVWKDERTPGFTGWCLKTCRTAWDLPADEPSAITEWNSIPDKYKNTKWWQAPIGAPHFWSGGTYGHVALQAATVGVVWSSDAPILDKVGKVPLKWFEDNWGYTYLGWSSQFQNEKLPLPDMPAIK